ncbi:hypothetical protein LTR22_017269 [Elasticomyces elasticus]|nr:hypothetical protein LTR22_017269 [Elasticomyces elasticus]KAK4925349.1 hypothetical protein LTR49_007647 [Elasticomyces elasticus]
MANQQIPDLSELLASVDTTASRIRPRPAVVRSQSSANDLHIHAYFESYGESSNAQIIQGLLANGTRDSNADILPATYATVKALHLLSGTVPIEKSFGYLEHARQTIKEASKTGDPAVLKDPAMLQTLYERTAELWALYQREKAGELFGAWPDAVEVKAQA